MLPPPANASEKKRREKKKELGSLLSLCSTFWVSVRLEEEKEKKNR